MSFGKRLIEARKKKGMSQGDVAKLLSTKAPVISRYERDEAKPSIEAAARLANLLEVSLDYLVGNASQEIDRPTTNRILELQQLPKDIQDKLYFFIDMSIRDFKAKQACLL